MRIMFKMKSQTHDDELSVLARAREWMKNKQHNIEEEARAIKLVYMWNKYKQTYIIYIVNLV